MKDPESMAPRKEYHLTYRRRLVASKMRFPYEGRSPRGAWYYTLRLSEEERDALDTLAALEEEARHPCAQGPTALIELASAASRAPEAKDERNTLYMALGVREGAKWRTGWSGAETTLRAVSISDERAGREGEEVVTNILVAMKGLCRLFNLITGLDRSVKKPEKLGRMRRRARKDER